MSKSTDPKQDNNNNNPNPANPVPATTDNIPTKDDNKKKDTWKASTRFPNGFSVDTHDKDYWYEDDHITEILKRIAEAQEEKLKNTKESPQFYIYNQESIVSIQDLKDLNLDNNDRVELYEYVNKLPEPVTPTPNPDNNAAVKKAKLPKPIIFLVNSARSGSHWFFFVYDPSINEVTVYDSIKANDRASIIKQDVKDFLHNVLAQKVTDPKFDGIDPAKPNEKTDKYKKEIPPIIDEGLVENVTIKNAEFCIRQQDTCLCGLASLSNIVAFIERVDFKDDITVKANDVVDLRIALDMYSKGLLSEANQPRTAITNYDGYVTALSYNLLIANDKTPIIKNLDNNKITDHQKASVKGQIDKYKELTIDLESTWSTFFGMDEAAHDQKLIDYFITVILQKNLNIADIVDKKAALEKISKDLISTIRQSRAVQLDNQVIYDALKAIQSDKNFDQQIKNLAKTLCDIMNTKQEFSADSKKRNTFGETIHSAKIQQEDAVFFKVIAVVALCIGIISLGSKLIKFEQLADIFKSIESKPLYDLYNFGAKYNVSAIATFCSLATALIMAVCSLNAKDQARIFESKAYFELGIKVNTTDLTK